MGNSLAGIVLLNGLSPDEVSVVEQACSWKNYAAQEQILDEHANSGDVYFIVEGHARVVNYSISGQEITLDDLLAGGHFGELAAIDGLPRSAGVVAVSDVFIAALPAQKLKIIVKEYPAIAMKLLQHLTQLVRTSTTKIMDLSTLGATNRIHADLLRLARLADGDGETAILTPIPLHGDVASRVASTRETVARVYNDLARKGVVERQKKSLLVKDLGVLEHMVSEVRGS